MPAYDPPKMRIVSVLIVTTVEGHLGIENAELKRGQDRKNINSARRDKSKVKTAARLK